MCLHLPVHCQTTTQYNNYLPFDTRYQMLSKAMYALQSSISHGAMSLTIYISMHLCTQLHVLNSNTAMWYNNKE